MNFTLLALHKQLLSCTNFIKDENFRSILDNPQAHALDLLSYVSKLTIFYTGYEDHDGTDHRYLNRESCSLVTDCRSYVALECTYYPSVNDEYNVWDINWQPYRVAVDRAHGKNICDAAVDLLLFLSDRIETPEYTQYVYGDYRECEYEIKF